jgi:hypothetical protein
MKYWEIIADNLKKRGWSWGCVSAARIFRSERSGLLTHTATPESGFVVRADEKLTACNGISRISDRTN